MKDWSFLQNCEYLFSTTTDKPDFKIKSRLISDIRKKGYQGKIIQYVCPSFWAWRKKRLQTLKSIYDLILAIYPFELSYFTDKTTAIYQKHPLLTIKSTHNKSLPLNCPNKKIVAIFPGSRSAEIKLNLKLQLLSLQNKTEFQPIISIASKKLIPQIKAICKQINSNALLYTKEYNNVIGFYNIHTSIIHALSKDIFGYEVFKDIMISYFVKNIKNYSVMYQPKNC